MDTSKILLTESIYPRVLYCMLAIYWRHMLLHIFHGPLCICKYLQRYISIIRTVITFESREWRTEKSEVMIKVNFSII